MVVDREESGPGASVSTEKVAPVSKRKLTDCSPSYCLLIAGAPQVLLGQGLVWGSLGTFSLDCPESLTPGAYASEGNLFSGVALYRLDMDLRGCLDA